MPISKVFFCNSGSEANDSQVKFVWYLNNALGRPQKKKIVSRVKAYHGVTIAAASLTGIPTNHRDFDLPLPGFLHAGCPHHYRFAQDGESEEDFATRLAAELDALIVKEGAGHGCGVHRRAGDGGGRRHRAAAHLLREDHVGLRQA